MNEPDFIVEEWERDLSTRVPRPIRFEILAELVSRLSGSCMNTRVPDHDGGGAPAQPVGVG